MKTHDTFILGFKDEKIAFIRTYPYMEQKEEARKVLDYVQENFDGWIISHVGNWILENKGEEDRHSFNIPLP